MLLFVEGNKRRPADVVPFKELDTLLRSIHRVHYYIVQRTAASWNCNIEFTIDATEITLKYNSLLVVFCSG